MKALVKILTAVVSLAAGAASSKLLESVWTKLTGDDVPNKKNKEAMERASVARIVTFAGVSAAVAALIGSGSQRVGQRFMERATSHPEEV